MEEPEERRYTEEGLLIVSELSRCPFFSSDTSSDGACEFEDCFFCKFSDFRKREYIEKMKSENHSGVLYSVCHNEKNNKLAI